MKKIKVEEFKELDTKPDNKRKVGRPLKQQILAKFTCPECGRPKLVDVYKQIKHTHMIDDGNKRIKESHLVLLKQKITCCLKSWTIHNIYATHKSKYGTRQISLAPGM